MEYKNFSNAELKLKLLELNNEYESLKNKISNFLDKMEILDKEYSKISTILINRTKGKL